MSEEKRSKTKNFWEILWTPIILLLLGGIGFLIKEKFFASATYVTGNLPGAHENVEFIFDGSSMLRINTDSHGNFRLDNVPFGRHYVQYKFPGYCEGYAEIDVITISRNHFTFPPLEARILGKCKSSSMKNSERIPNSNEKKPTKPVCLQEELNSQFALNLAWWCPNEKDPDYRATAHFEPGGSNLSAVFSKSVCGDMRGRLDMRILRIAQGVDLSPDFLPLISTSTDAQNGADPPQQFLNQIVTRQVGGKSRTYSIEANWKSYCNGPNLCVNVRVVPNCSLD